MIHDYTRKRGIVHSEILLPPNAPPDFQDRGSLWNSVEQIEKACNSQLARELEVALPIELSLIHILTGLMMMSYAVFIMRTPPRS